MSASSSIASNESMPPKKPLAGYGLLQGSPGALAITPARDGPNHATSGCDVRYRVDELLRGGREAILVHREQEYRLRITSTGKLILTK